MFNSQKKILKSVVERKKKSMAETCLYTPILLFADAVSYLSLCTSAIHKWFGGKKPFLSTASIRPRTTANNERAVQRLQASDRVSV